MTSNTNNYLNRAISYLPFQPVRSVSSIEILNQLEIERGIKLPAAIREWYELEGVTKLMAKSIDGQEISIEKLGQPMEGWGEEPLDTLEDNMLLLLIENQGVCSWAAVLNGADDPPVCIEYDSLPEPEWEPYAPTFSSYIESLTWRVAAYQQPYHFYAGFRESPGLIRRISSELNMKGVTLEYTNAGEFREHYYSGEGLFLSAHTHEGWRLFASSPEALLQLSRAAVSLGLPAASFRAGNEKSKELLKHIS